MAAVVLIWGAFLPASKIALAAIDPYWFTLLRYGAAGLAFIFLLYFKEGRRGFRLEGQGWKLFAYGSVGFAGFSLLVFEGLQRALPEHGAMIIAISPMHIALWQWWKNGRKPHGFVLACIAAALTGEALVVSHGDLLRLFSGGSALGNGMFFLASLLWAAYTLGGHALKNFSSLRYSTFSVALGWLAIAAATLTATGVGHSAMPTLAGLQSVIWALLFVVIVVSVVGILFWNMAVFRLGPLDASLLANFTPLVTYGIALAEGRYPLPMELAGVLLVIAALIASNRFQRSRLATLVC